MSRSSGAERAGFSQRSYPSPVGHNDGGGDDGGEDSQPRFTLEDVKAMQENYYRSRGVVPPGTGGGGGEYAKTLSMHMVANLSAVLSAYGEELRFEQQQQHPRLTGGSTQGHTTTTTAGGGGTAHLEVHSEDEDCGSTSPPPPLLIFRQGGPQRFDRSRSPPSQRQPQVARFTRFEKKRLSKYIADVILDASSLCTTCGLSLGEEDNVLRSLSLIAEPSTGFAARGRTASVPDALEDSDVLPTPPLVGASTSTLAPPSSSQITGGVGVAHPQAQQQQQQHSVSSSPKRNQTTSKLNVNPSSFGTNPNSSLCGGAQQEAEDEEEGSNGGIHSPDSEAIAATMAAFEQQGGVQHSRGGQGTGGDREDEARSPNLEVTFKSVISYDTDLSPKHHLEASSSQYGSLRAKMVMSSSDMFSSPLGGTGGSSNNMMMINNNLAAGSSSDNSPSKRRGSGNNNKHQQQQYHHNNASAASPSRKDSGASDLVPGAFYSTRDSSSSPQSTSSSGKNRRKKGVEEATQVRQRQEEEDPRSRPLVDTQPLGSDSDPDADSMPLVVRGSSQARGGANSSNGGGAGGSRTNHPQHAHTTHHNGSMNASGSTARMVPGVPRVATPSISGSSHSSSSGIYHKIQKRKLEELVENVLFLSGTALTEAEVAQLGLVFVVPSLRTAVRDSPESTGGGGGGANNNSNINNNNGNNNSMNALHTPETAGLEAGGPSSMFEELKAGGSAIPVTLENWNEFRDLVIQYAEYWKVL